MSAGASVLVGFDAWAELAGDSPTSHVGFRCAGPVDAAPSPR